jgi:hypothetical protein
MRSYKRAAMIARSIIKMIEDGGGELKDIHTVTVRLPPTTFDSLRDDTGDTMKSATEMRIQGVVFKRGSNGSRGRVSAPARLAAS